MIDNVDSALFTMDLIGTDLTNAVSSVTENLEAFKKDGALNDEEFSE